VISFRPDPELLGQIEKAARRLGVSRNTVTSVLIAAELAHATERPLPPDRQLQVDAIVAAIRAPEDEEGRRP
jgi:hypothetical protein